MANYIIKPGDTLSAIARNNNTDVNTIMKLNPNIKNPNLIYSGNNLILPDAQPSQPAQPAAPTQPVAQPTVQPTPPAAQPTTPIVNASQGLNTLGNQVKNKLSGAVNNIKDAMTGNIADSVNNALQPQKSLLEQAEEYARGGIGDAVKSLYNPYDAVMEKSKQALQGQRDLMESKINAQRDDVLQAYQNNARQAYINSMLGKQQVGQQLAQAGLNTSGLVGSAYANVENAYGNSLAGLQTSRDNSINNINRQLNEAQMQYDIEENKLLADIEQAKIEWNKYQDELAHQKYQDAINNYYRFANMEHEWDIDERNFNYNKNIYNRDYQHQLDREAIEDAYRDRRDSVGDSHWQQQYDRGVYEYDNDNNLEQQKFAADEAERLRQYKLALEEIEARKKANSSTSSSGSSSRSSSRSSSGSSSSGSKTTGNYSVPDDTPTVTQNTPQSNNTTQSTSNNTLNEAQTNIYTKSAEKILRFSQPNSLQRKTMLQDLVNRGVLTQEEADILLSA